MRKRVAILGSTGSIGTQALDLVRHAPDRFEVIALAAGGQRPDLLARQAIEHHVEVVAVSAATSAEDVQLALYAEAARRGWDSGDHRIPRLLAGPTAAAQVAAIDCDVVLNGMTGAVGLEPTLAALRAGTTLALANKESLIIGGSLVTGASAPGQLVPVDSEHSALAQALRGERSDDVARLVVTASGGPFRGLSRDELRDVTPEQAAAHPTWDMGPVITINSATLVNKGLEVIEAHLLFDIDFDRIEVVVHPSSVVHSMVEFVDGSTMVQASPPDMRLPIALGLAWPERVPGAARACDWSSPTTWEFFPLDEQTFTAVALARRAGRAGSTAPAVFNSANEECVDAFVAGHIGFLDITDIIGQVLDQHLLDVDPHATMSLERVLSADRDARDRVHQVIEALRTTGVHSS